MMSNNHDALPQPGSALAEVPTPALLVDDSRLLRNIARMHGAADRHGVLLRPHFKTCKSVAILSRLLESRPKMATVSTLAEAEYLATHGIRDLLYAVPVTPAKLNRVLRLIEDGVALKIIIDAAEMADAVAALAATAERAIPTLIEIDSDGKRSGLKPGDPQVSAMAATLSAGQHCYAGLMTHYGASYSARTLTEAASAAEAERVAAVSASDTVLDGAGLPSPIVSVGATPTALAAATLSGVTEIRPGTSIFFDLQMAATGICEIDDIALSVLGEVISVADQPHRLFTDTGWTSLSADLGPHRSRDNGSFGQVTDLAGQPIAGLVLSELSQEHGTITLDPVTAGEEAKQFLKTAEIGTRFRVLPNHCCATANQHGGYLLHDSAGQILGSADRMERGF